MAEVRQGTQDAGTTDPVSIDQPQPSPEPTEDASQFNAAKAEEYYDAYRNQQQWQKTNTQRAQELAEQRNQVAQERQRMEQLAQTVTQQQQLASKLIEQATPKPSDSLSVPDPLDQPDELKRYISEQHQAIQRNEQALAGLRQQQESYQRQWADRLTTQSINSFQATHPELTQDQLTTIAQTVRDRIKPAYTEDGLPYYDTQQLEDGFKFVMGPQQLQEARSQGREEVVETSRQARAAQGVSGRKAGTSVEKDLAYYIDHFNEFQSLSDERKMELLTPPEM